MAGALLTEAKFGQEIVSLLVATEKIAESLVRAIQGGLPDAIELPTFPEFAFAHEAG
jgi:hypothetical protein